MAILRTFAMASSLAYFNHTNQDRFDWLHNFQWNLARDKNLFMIQVPRFSIWHQSLGGWNTSTSFYWIK
jgi:hypothetical protein